MAGKTLEQVPQQAREKTIPCKAMLCIAVLVPEPHTKRVKTKTAEGHPEKLANYASVS